MTTSVQNRTFSVVNWRRHLIYVLKRNDKNILGSTSY